MKYTHWVEEEVGGVFVKFRLSYLKKLDGDCTAAVVLAFLMNKLWLKLQSKPDLERLEANHMKFQCMGKQIEKSLCITKRVRSSAIKKLEAAGFITTYHRWGNKLWIHVNQQKAKNPTSEEAVGSNGSVTSGSNRTVTSLGSNRTVTSHITKNYRKNGKEELPPAARSGRGGRLGRSGHSPAKEHLRERRWVDTFYNAAHNYLQRSRKGIKRADPNGAWRQFVKLQRKAEPELIDEVVHWYAQSLDQDRLQDDKIPEAYCAATFYEKFDRILAAMARLTKVSKKKRDQQNLIY